MAANDTTTEIMVIGYGEIEAGDIILAASGPNCWKGLTYNFVPLRPEPITDEFELDLYRSEEDGRSIFVVERTVAVVPDDADPCDTCSQTGGHFPHLCSDCGGWGYIPHELRGLEFSMDGGHDTNEERMGLR